MIDTHVHLLDAQMAPDLTEILKRAQTAGVKKMVNICTSLEELERIDTLPPFVYSAAAITPHEAHLHLDDYAAAIEKAAKMKKLIAIGETGLELFHEPQSEKVQIKWLLWHLELAQRCNLPVLIHCRGGFDLLFDTIDAHFPKVPILLHCFTGTAEDAKKATDRGWMISISGIITFPKSEQLREVVKDISMDFLVAETDAPWLSPKSHRGNRNEPAYISETINTIASLHAISFDACATKTAENACSFFKFAL